MTNILRKMLDGSPSPGFVNLLADQGRVADGAAGGGKASLGDRPRSCCSSASSSRSDCSSRSRSALRFLICHQCISALLGRGPHHARDRFGHLFPLRFFGEELLFAFLREPVVFEFPIAIGSGLPFGYDPAALFQTVQGRIEGTV